MKPFLPLIAIALGACSAPLPHCAAPESGNVVYVVESGWHAEIGVPANELSPDLAFLRHVFSGARVIMIGYGKKTFFTAPPQTFSEYILGPFPGSAVIHAVGIRVTPPEAYPPEETLTLKLPPGGRQKLLAFIAQDLVRGRTGRPQVVAPSHDPEGMFYAARSRYNLLHTCNSWTAQALHAAGFPVSSSFVAFSGQVAAQLKKACAP